MFIQASTPISVDSSSPTNNDAGTPKKQEDPHALASSDKTKHQLNSSANLCFCIAGACVAAALVAQPKDPRIAVGIFAAVTASIVVGGLFKAAQKMRDENQSKVDVENPPKVSVEKSPSKTRSPRHA